MFIDHPMCEACTASLAFLAWIIFFKTLHTTSIGAAFRFKNSRPTSFTTSFTKDIGIYVSFPVYLASIYIYHTWYHTKPLHLTRLPQDHLYEHLGLTRLSIEVCTGIFMYDIIFWCVHVVMHRSPTVFALVHQQHHTHKHLTPGSTVSHTLVDGAVQVLVNIMVQQYSPYGYKHSLSRLVHNVVVTYMLVEIHSELDAPWSLHNLFGGRVFGGALRHRYHHAYTLPHFKGTKAVHYHQFFRLLDDLAGYAVSDEECRAVKFEE